MKKIIGIFAAVLLLASAVVQATFYTVSTPFSQNEAIDTAYEWDEYGFYVPSSGTYSFYTTGSTDTVGDIWVQDVYGSWYILDTNDDGGDDGLNGYGLNFCVDANLIAGEIATIEVSGFYTSTGAYTVYGQSGACADMPSGDSGSLGLLTILASFMTLMVLRLKKRA